MKNPLWLKIFTALSFIMMLIVQIRAIGSSDKESNITQIISEVNNLFAPIQFTFVIWIAIYILLALYVIYQFGLFNKKQSDDQKEMISKYSTLFSLIAILNTSWIYSLKLRYYGMSLIFIIAMLALIIVIMLDIKKRFLSPREEMFVHLPFSIYFGWITFATIGNISTFLKSANWNGFGLPEVFWAGVVLIIGAVIGVAAIISYRDIFYGLVLIWSYSGVLIKHLSPFGYGGEHSIIIIIASICLVVLGYTVTHILLKKGR